MNTKKIFLTFFILTFANAFCFSQETLDLETLPSHRTKQYSIAPYKKVIVFSAPRTGHILTYNVFRFLFEEDSKIFSRHDAFEQDRLVLRTHRFYELNTLKEKNTLYIFTTRNPLTACVSHYRIHPAHITDYKAFARQALDLQQSYLAFYEPMGKNGMHVAQLKYEDFADNIDYLFTFIEKHFSLSIAPEDKEWMRRGYSKQNVYSSIRDFADFNSYLPISGFHGKHVNLNNFTPPDEYINWLKFYLEEYKPLFQKYGYFLGEI